MKNKKQVESHEFNNSILRAYDIRGIVGETISEKDAYYIGLSFGSFIAKEGESKKVCVGFDGRHSSPILEDKLVRGLQESGAEVIRIGLGPTPMLYFSVKHFQADGGIMITGSHNPPSHNGFKMMLAKAPVFGDDILKLGEIAKNGDFAYGSGSVSFEDVKADYVKHLMQNYRMGKEPLKIAWDAGNGAAGEIMRELAILLPGTHYLLNEKIDGDFPAHHPDPSVEANMLQLIDKVRAEGCDAGIAFDGDGDRIGVVDNKGNMIFGDQLMVVFAEYILKSHKGEKIIADVKASQILFDEIAKMGGQPIMWKTGHSLIKTKMFAEDAILAGEMSGHIFFKDNSGFDDGLFAAVMLLNILNEMDGDLSDRIEQIPQTYNTPEIRVAVVEEQKFGIVDAVRDIAKGQGLEVNDIDGARAQISGGWWLVRASNTEAALVIRCEADSQSNLEKVKTHVFDLLNKQGVEI